MYNWVAEYVDGTTICQQGPLKEESTLALDRRKLSSFTLFDGPRGVFTRHVVPGEVFFYRRRARVHYGPAPGGPDVCHIVGCFRRVGAEIFYSLNYVFEGGGVDAVGGFIEGNKWMYPPQLTEEELNAPGRE